MSASPNLDDINQAVFFIPFAGGDDDDEDYATVPLPKSLHTERDLPHVEDLRVEAYTQAWRKCLERLRSIIQALHAPIAADIVHQVQTSYDNILPGLPYAELPVICITNATSGSAFMDEITTEIDSSQLDNDTLFGAPAFTTHLYPNDCGNITSTMKTMITGFINRPHVLQKAKTRSATSLANYDIELLVFWYIAVRAAHGLVEKFHPKLVVVLHDFEQLDPIVIQDFFNISRLYVPRLPLVFILSLSSPSSPSYLHITYPRSTLALLRIRNFSVPSGPKILEEMIMKTFFDIEFEPEVMIGPTLQLTLIDYFTRKNSSLEGALTILHIAHLKHFSAEPLTLLARATPPSDILEQPSAFPFLESLIYRLYASSQDSTSLPAANPSKQMVATVIASMDNARVAFKTRARRLRLGFGILKLIQDFMTEQGYKGLAWDKHPDGLALLEVMADVLRGTVGPDIKFLGSMIRKLRASQLSALVEILHTYFNSMPSHVRSSEEEARMKFVFSTNALPQNPDNDEPGAVSQIASSFSAWWVEYVNGLLAPLEDATLWDIWYTGLSPFPSDVRTFSDPAVAVLKYKNQLVNPSLRACVVAGLLRPHDFVVPNDDDDARRVEFSLWELPDTSILFRRYLDSGKMINVYDWFESFQLVLESQQRNLKKKRAAEIKSRPRSPTKRAGKGKGKTKAARREEEADDEVDEVEDEDRWKLEVQARFMRAMHELDYLGFIKHTGRKADHVLRTAFDMYD